jgi:hypothetical protein
MANDLTRKPQTIAIAASSPAYSRPQWLDLWSPHEPVPVTAGQVAEGIAAAELSLMPADPMATAGMLAETLDLYGPLPANWERVGKFYVEAFEDVPADLVAKAMKAHRLSPKPFFPKPGELRAHISDELGARKRALIKLRLARGSIRPPAPAREPLTEEQETKLRETVATLEAAARKMTERPAPKVHEGEPITAPCDVEPTREDAAE